MKHRTTIQTILPALCWCMVAGYTGLYISLIFNDNIWTDEAFTWQLLHSGGIREIILGTAQDVHPPLYYLWAKLFTAIFGDNLQVLKIASIVPMSGLLVYGATTIRRSLGDLEAYLFLLFIANIPCTMEFAVQPRMYSASLLCVTVCGMSAYLAFTRNWKRDWFWYAITALGAAYLHYFAFVAVGIVGLILLVRILWDIFANFRGNSGKKSDASANTVSVAPANARTSARADAAAFTILDERQSAKNRLRRWLMTLVLMAAGYAPWLPYLVRQVTSVEKGYWIPALTYDTVIQYFNWAFGLNTSWGSLTTYMVMTILISGGAILIYNKDKWQAREHFAMAAMLVPALTFAFGVIVSILPGRSAVYRDQYILPALGLLALFFAIALSEWGRQALVIVTCLMLALGAAQYKECYRQEYHSSYVDQTEAFFEEHASAEDPVIYDWEVYGLIYEYYWPRERLFYYEDFDWASDFDQAWLLATYNEWLPTADFLNSYGLGIEDMGPYGIEHNNFEIYRIFPMEQQP